MSKSRRSITFRLDAWELFLLAAFVTVLVNGVWRWSFHRILYRASAR